MISLKNNIFKFAGILLIILRRLCYAIFMNKNNNFYWFKLKKSLHLS